MRGMEHSTVSTPSTASVRGPQTDAVTDERYIPHFRSLTMPGLVKGPILPAWLSKLFHRTDTPATR
jgi:hypothetical protein